jgi:hypothetical protein
VNAAAINSDITIMILIVHKVLRNDEPQLWKSPFAVVRGISEIPARFNDSGITVYRRIYI